MSRRGIAQPQLRGRELRADALGHQAASAVKTAQKRMTNHTKPWKNTSKRVKTMENK